MKHIFAALLLLATATLGSSPSVAQQQHSICNTSTGAYCNTSSNPGNGQQGDPAWLFNGKYNANFDQIFTMLGPTGSLPLPLYGLEFNNNGTLASLLPGGTGTWCLNWTVLGAPPTLISCGSGSGTVTSVGLTVPSWLTVVPSSITTSGIFSITGTIEPNNQVLASAPNGSPSVLAPRALVAADIPVISAATNLSGTLQAAQFPGLLGDVTNTAGTLSTTVSRINGLPVPTSAGLLSTNSSAQLIAISTPLAISLGGTGTASPSLLPGTNITITGSWPNQTINSTGGGGGGNVSTAGSPAQHQVGIWATGTTLGGVNPSSTVGEAFVSNGTSADPGFSTSLPGVTSVNGTTIPNTSVLLTAAGSPGQYQTSVWNSGSGVGGIGPGTAGQAFVSGGASAYPSYSSALSDVNSVNGTSIPASATLLTSGGALGTPSSGVATNLTGLPLTTGVTGVLPGANMTPVALGSSSNGGVSGVLPIANGGTGATTLAAANIPVQTGAITSGHCVEWLNATTIEDAGAGCGAGGSNAFSALTGSTNTTATMLVGTGASLGPTGSGTVTANALASGTALGTPASGTLTNVTGLPISTGVSGLGTGIATFLGTPTSANLGAALINETGTGFVVFSTSPTLTSPALSGSSSGITTLASANASATNFTLTFPAITDTVVTLSATQTLTNKSIAGTEVNSGVVGIGFGGTGATTLAGASIAVFSGTPTSGHCVEWLSATVIEDSGSVCGSGGSTAFSALTGSTNTTAAMLVGSGASLGPTGTGTITATSLSALTGLPTIASNTLLANTSGSTAAPTATTAAAALGLLQSLTCNAQVGTTYTTVIGDANSCVTMSNTSANTVTIPTNASVAYAIGTTLTLEENNTGITTVAPAAGVTFCSAQYGCSGSQTYALAGNYDFIQIQQTVTNTWLVTEVGPGRATMAGVANLASTAFGGVTGILGIANGGTGASTLAGASIPTYTGAITATHCAEWSSSGVLEDSGATCGGGGGGGAFSALTSGTNTAAAMLVGTGASLGVTGSGTITATAVPFSGVTPATNTSALVIGTSGSLATSGTGTIAATSLTVLTGLPAMANGTILANGSGSSASASATTAPNVIAILNAPTCDAQTGTTYTGVLGDANGCITMSNASANTFTVPANSSVAYPVGTILTVEQLSTGITTVSPASGVTFQSVQYGSSTSQTYALAAAYDYLQLKQTAANTWLVVAVGQGSDANRPSTIPTIASGFGTTPSVTHSALHGSTWSFSVNVGTGGSATSGVITMPTAPDAWACSAADGGTTPTGRTEPTALSASSVTVTNYSRTTGTATAWTASEIVQLQCTPN